MIFHISKRAKFLNKLRKLANRIVMRKLTSPEKTVEKYYKSILFEHLTKWDFHSGHYGQNYAFLRFQRSLDKDLSEDECVIEISLDQSSFMITLVISKELLDKLPAGKRGLFFRGETEKEYMHSIYTNADFDWEKKQILPQGDTAIKNGMKEIVPRLMALNGFVFGDMIGESDEPKNNQGRDECWWCGKKTDKRDAITDVYDICPSCDK